MTEKEVMVLCYWNGCIKYGPDGVYYEGSTPKKISVKQKTHLSRLVDGLHIITGLHHFEIFGKYPVAISPNLFTYVHLPVVSDSSLEAMLEVPSNHPSINSVELYLETKPTSDDVINSAACSLPLDNLGGSLKRQRTIQQPQEANGYVEMDVTHPSVKLERDDNNGSTQGAMMDRSSGSDEMAQAVNLAADNDNAPKDLIVPGLETSANACLDKGVHSRGLKPQFLSNLWGDGHELRVGLCFKDKDELKKVVDWCSIKGRQKCIVQETKKDEYTFKCIRWKCNWSLCAARMEEHGLVEITECIGPHTCCPTTIGPYKFDLEFAAEEIECLLRLHPTLTIDELNNWWLEKYGYGLQTSEMKAAKQEVIKNIYGDWDQSFRVLPKLLDALHSSNGLVVDWQYDLFPNPEFASFGGVFGSFSQSIEGFPHCRPLIVVDTKDLNGKYPMKLMIASGVDAEDRYYPLAFAVTTKISTDSWRWFLTGIREKVSQRQGLCLISRLDPDILTVVNEPESLWKEPWAYHRFCLDHLCSRFYDMFQNSHLKNLMKKAALAMQNDEFDALVLAIKKENPKAWKWLDQIPTHHWALAHDGGRRYGVEGIDTEELFSICKSFQSLDLPLTAIVLLLFDEIKSCFLVALCDSKGSLKCGDVYTSPVMEKLEEFMSASITYVIMPLDKGVFHVTKPLQKDGWTVRLSECTCSCGEFQLMKFPCPHALAVCEKLKFNPLQYVDDCYTLERYNKTYAATFSSVPEVSDWPEAFGVPTLLPPVVLPLPPPAPPTKVLDKSKQKAIQKC